MRDRRFLRRALLAPALALLLADIAVVSSAAATSSTAPARPSVAGSIIVGFKPGVSPATQAKALARAGATLRHRFRRIRSTLVAVAPKARPAAIRRLERDPRVAYAEPNFVVHADDVTPNDPFFTQLWGLDNTGQTVNWTTGAPDADIDAKEAWSVSTGSPDVVVAVIDTGVDGSHPDLAPNMWINQGENCTGCRTNAQSHDTQAANSGG